MSKSSCEILREFDDESIKKLNEAYTKKLNVDDINGIGINHEPFTHCSISNLISNDKFLRDLRKESLKLKFKQKNNDLYKFHQTGDLSKSKSPSIIKFRELLYGKFLGILKKITGIELTSSRIDLTSSKYTHTDYLLCHDDDIHGETEGRRIAFIFYLVQNDWQESDGGCLDLFNVNDNLQPVDIVKSIVPVENRILFFEVSDRSFHQVSEVLSENKVRLSIHGWFHGPVNYRPPPYIELYQNPKQILKIDHDLFFDWIQENYIEPFNQSTIQEKFCKSSEIKLDKFFSNEKYRLVDEALKSDCIKWNRKGPRNRRNYEVADEDTLPEIVRELVKILTSDCMGLTLSNLTGLCLHESCKKEKKNEGNNDDDDSEVDGDLSENDEEKKDAGASSNGKVVDDDCCTSKPCTSASASLRGCEEPPNKKQRKEDESKNKDQNNNNESKNCMCHYEVRRWSQGSYTLITDDDHEMQISGLDAMFFFNCGDDWKEEYGGNVSYIARDEDDELLTVYPEENCLALVFRDEETLKFTKYVNSNIKTNADIVGNCFYEIYVVYYE